MDILGHDGDSLGVDGTKVGVLEETDEVSFRGFLESEDGGGLESELLVERLGDFSNESLEWELSEEEISGLLISSDFSEGDGTWSESVWFFDTTSGSGGFSGGLSGEGLLGGFSRGRFSSGLLSSGHFCQRLLFLVFCFFYYRLPSMPGLNYFVYPLFIFNEIVLDNA